MVYEFSGRNNATLEVDEGWIALDREPATGRCDTARHTDVSPYGAFGRRPYEGTLAIPPVSATGLSQRNQGAISRHREPACNTAVTPSPKLRDPLVIHWNAGDNFGVFDKAQQHTQNREETQYGASANAGQLPVGDGRHPGCFARHNQYCSNAGYSPADTGTTTPAGGSPSAGLDAGQRPLALTTVTRRAA